MEQKNLASLLLRTAISATICDGEIDDSELEVIKSWASSDFYLRTIDYEREIDEHISIAKNNPLQFNDASLAMLRNEAIEDSQKFIILQILLSVIKADKIIKDSEIQFVKSAILNLKLSESLVESVFGKWWIYEFNAI